MTERGAGMGHAITRRRAEAALALRAQGHTWSEVADALGYKTRSGAQQAVNRLHASNPPESVEDIRREAKTALRLLQVPLFGRLAEAVKRGDDQAVAALSREIRGVVAESSKLQGLYAPERHTVAVSVTAEDTRARLLAVAAQHDQLTARRPAAIEGEVIR